MYSSGVFMRLTTKGRYAVTAMLDVALHANEGTVNLAEISQRQGISVSYLEQLFARLRKSGLVKSVRGPGGGYRLSRGRDRITIAEIIDAVDEPVDATRCERRGDCQEGDTCLTHFLWMALSDKIHEFLADISLADLIDKPEILAVAQRQQLAAQQRLQVATV